MPKRGRLEASPSARAGDAKVARGASDSTASQADRLLRGRGQNWQGKPRGRPRRPRLSPAARVLTHGVLNDPVVDSHVLTAGTDTPALIGPAYVSLYAVDKLVSQEKIKITGTRVERHGPHVRSHLDTVVAP